MKTAKVTSGGLGKSVAEGDSHEGRSAGGGDDDGKDSGEEAAGVSLLRGERTARTGERESDFELAGEGEAEEEEQCGHQREKYGRLELESPAEVRAGRAETEQQGHQRPEGNENAGGVDESVGAQLMPLMVARLHQRQTLDEEHREDAGHEVEDESAEEGQAGGLQEARTRMRIVRGRANW